MEKSATGLTDNVAGALTYLLGFVTGIFFLVVEKKSKFVRFHAMQSTILFGAYVVISLALGFIPVIDVLWAIVAIPLGLLVFVLWLFLMYKAYQGEQYEVPIVGPIARKQLEGMPAGGPKEK